MSQFLIVVYLVTGEFASFLIPQPVTYTQCKTIATHLLKEHMKQVEAYGCVKFTGEST